MDRFLLFVFDPKKPSGGWGDFVGDYADLKTAQKDAGKVKKTETYQIVEPKDGRIIETHRSKSK